MGTEVLEGTWEEISQHAKNLVGRKLRLTVLEDESAPKPNEAMLEALDKVSERSANMPVSANVDTLKMIREARSGGMFGDSNDN